MPSRALSLPRALARHPRLQALLWSAAIAAAALDLAQRTPQAPNAPESVSFHGFTPSLPELGAGAPYTAFPTLSAAFFTFHLHGQALPLVLLLTLTTYRWSHRLGAAGSMQRVLGSLGTALVLLAGVDGLVLEPRSRDWRFRGHPTRIWQMSPCLYNPRVLGYATDGDGYRLTPSPQAGRPGWLLLGDSTTYGVRVYRTEETYAWRLAGRLEQSGQPVNIFNRAIPGYTSWQGRLMLGEQLPVLHPQLVTAAFMANDWTWATQPDSALEGTPAVRPLRTWLRKRTTYLWLESLLLGEASLQQTRFDHASPSQAVRVPVEAFRSNLNAMADQCASAGTPLALICLPMAPALDAISAPYRACVAEVGRARSLTVLDLHREWAQSGLNRCYFAPEDPIHPLPAGHERIAARLAERLPSIARGTVSPASTL